MRFVGPLESASRAQQYCPSFAKMRASSRKGEIFSLGLEEPYLHDAKEVRTIYINHRDSNSS